MKTIKAIVPYVKPLNRQSFNITIEPIVDTTGQEVYILLMPKALWDVFNTKNFRPEQPQSILSTLEALPSFFCRVLGGSLTEFEQAKIELRTLLKDYVPEEFLSPPQNTSRVYGAMPPRKDEG